MENKHSMIVEYHTKDPQTTIKYTGEKVIYYTKKVKYVGTKEQILQWIIRNTYGYDPITHQFGRITNPNIKTMYLCTK